MNPNAKPFVPNPNAAAFVPAQAPPATQPHHGPRNVMRAASQFLQPNYPVAFEPRDGRPVYSLDVECIATGATHSARFPCKVVVVDYHLNVVLDCTVKPDVRILSVHSGSSPDRSCGVCVFCLCFSEKTSPVCTMLRSRWLLARPVPSIFTHAVHGLR